MTAPSEREYTALPLIPLRGNAKLLRLRAYLLNEGGAEDFYGKANDRPAPEGHFQIFNTALSRVRDFSPQDAELYADWRRLSIHEAVAQGRRSPELNESQFRMLAHIGSPVVYTIAVLEQLRGVEEVAAEPRNEDVEPETIFVPARFADSRGATTDLQNTFIAHTLFAAGFYKGTLSQNPEYSNTL